MNKNLYVQLMRRGLSIRGWGGDLLLKSNKKWDLKKDEGPIFHSAATIQFQQTLIQAKY